MPVSAKRILIAPLDWGLGHTTRCLPIIRRLQALGHMVVFAGDEPQLSFVRQCFPGIDTLSLEGYMVRYSRRMLMFTLLWQLPRLLRVIRREHEWLNEIIFKEGIDGIISDNRYGMWHVQIPSVILTHQPGVLTGLGSAADKIIRDIHYRYLRRFGEVWIPDLPGRPNLGGRLSHPDSLPERSRYIGWLSQFRPHQKAGNREEHILILLSGPEPQRTMLADKLWQQAKTLQQPIVFIEGKAGIERKDALPHIRHIPFADTQMLQPLLENASLVICRSGYSTLMDLAGFSKPAVLIPTPGQTEQEYLAHNLASAGFFYRADQKDISLANAVKLAESGSKPGMSATLHDESLLASALDEWLAGL